ncbi:MAG: Coenzyme PQQ synthesis protein B, partial [uncultured Acetobacteraceae bacterium]
CCTPSSSAPPPAAAFRNGTHPGRAAGARGRATR